MNDPVYVEAAGSLCENDRAHARRRPGQNHQSVRRAVARKPSDAEIETLMDPRDKHGSWFSVAQVLLNLDETITKS